MTDWTRLAALYQLEGNGALNSIQKMAVGELRNRWGEFKGNINRVVEPALAMGTGMAGQAVGGIVGAAGLPFGVDAAANAVKRTQDAMTYQPRTLEGLEGMRKVQDFGENIANRVNTAAGIGTGALTYGFTGDINQAAQAGGNVYNEGFSQAAGDYTLDKTGSPLLATGAAMIGPAIDAIAGTKLAGKIPGQQFEMGDIGSQQFGQRGAVSGVNSLDELKAIADAEQAKFDTLKKPIQEEFRDATGARKDELKAELTALRQVKDAASSRFFAEKQRQAPKKAKVTDNRPTGKPFKGVGFHQTSESFDDFDFSKSADGTTWFTTDKANFSDPSSSASAASGKGRVIERNIDLKKAAGFDEMDRFTIDELQSMGFDGAVLDGDVQIFSKSAISKPKGGTAKSEGDSFTRTTGDKAVDDQISEVVMMTPDKYLQEAFEVTNGRMGGAYQGWLESNARTPEQTAAYAKSLTEGDVFPMPYINYRAGSQDGRNRALAAKQAGIKEIPVGIVKELSPKQRMAEIDKELLTATGYKANRLQNELDRLNKGQ